jgi:hypothetical protein
LFITGNVRDALGIKEEDDEAPLRSSQELEAEVVVSASTIDRVKKILEEGSEAQIKALKSNRRWVKGLE